MIATLLKSLSKEAIYLAPLLPAPGSDEESEWLVNSRQAVADRRTYIPDQDDMAALSKIRHFEFGLNQVNIRFWLSGGSGVSDQFENEEDLIVLLEGLCWE